LAERDILLVNKLPVLALLPLLFVSAPAFGQSDGAQCASIENGVDRLACYDGLFRPGTVPTGALEAVLESTQLIPARPSGRAPATLTVRCEAGDLSIRFGFAGNTLSALGNDAGLTLQYDLQTDRSRTLPVDTSNTAIIIGDRAEASAFVDSLAGATNLTARVTPVNSRSLSVRFRVDSFVQEAQAVRDGCS
jgi:type VI secretion system protein VasI